MNWIKPLLPGIVGALVGGGAAWLATRGIDISKDTQAQIVGYLVGIILPLFGVVAGVTHKVVAKYVNPGDAASTQLVEEHIHENAQLKAAGSNSPSVIQ
jgi:hypothetical protein